MMSPGIRRIPFLDMLRGIAVLGILVMNIQGFAQVELAYLSPPVLNPLTPAESVLHALGYLFIDQKFVSLFSLLFGVSAWIVATNARAAGMAWRDVHRRRNLGLLLIGLVHAYLIWDGDILVSYALAALLLTRSLEWSLRRQIQVALAMLSVPLLLSLAEYALLPPGELASQYDATPETLQDEITALRGDWFSVQAWRLRSALEMHLWGIPFWNLWFAGGLMLVGMVLFRLGIARAVYPPAFYWRWVLGWGLPGFLLTLIAYLYQRDQGFALTSIALGRGVLAYLGALMMALGYLGLAVLLYQRASWPRVNRVFQAIGRMALSNYLLQSLVATGVFYGYGLGWFERLSLVQLLPVTLAIWALNASLSVVWLRHFQYGPVEWLWRWMTRGRRPAWRRAE